MKLSVLPSRVGNPRLFVKRLFLSMVFFAAINFSASAQRVASMSGNWSDPATWGNNPAPTASETATINAGITVTMDVPGSCASLTVTAGTAATIAGTSALTVIGNVTIPASATLSVPLTTINVGGTWTKTGTFTSGASTVNFNGAGAQSITGTGTMTFYNFSTSNGGTKTPGITTAITNNLAVGDGTTLLFGNITLTVGGTTTVGSGTSGILSFNNTGASRTFTGLITVATGGIWTSSVAAAFTIRGGITNNGTFTSGGGTYTFDTNNQNLNGTLSFTTMSVATGFTVTNNNTLTVTASLAGAGALTQATNAVLNLGGGTTPITTLNATATGNTVNYTANAVQIAHANAYFNLGLSGTNTKTITGISTVAGNFTLSGTAAATTNAAFAIGGNLSVGSGTTLTTGAFNFSVAGTTTIGGGGTGNFVLANTGTRTFIGAITIATGGIWNNTGGTAVTIQGGISNSGAFTAGAGVYTFSTNAQALSGTFAIPNVTVDVITLTNNGTLTVATALSGTGALVQGASSTLSIGGTAGISSLTASATGNTVSFTGAAAQTVNNINYYNLTLSGAGAKTLQTGTTVIANNFISSNVVSTVGNLAIGGNFTINADFTVPAFDFSVGGTTNINTGGLLLTGTTGARTFGGLITVSAGTSFTNSGNTNVTIRGGFARFGATGGGFTSGSGIYTFDTNNQSLSGTRGFTFTNITVAAGITLTNSTILIVSTSLTGAGEFLNDAAGNATFNFASVTIASLNATASGNTITYGLNGAQTVYPTVYNNLILGTGGTKTITSVLSITGNFTVNGSAIFTGNGAFTVDGAFIYGSTSTTATTLTASTPISVGTFSQTGNNGVLTLNSNTVTVTGTSATAWARTNGTLNIGTSTVIFAGTGAQGIGGTSANTFYNLTNTNTDATGLSINSATVTVTNNLTFASPSNGRIHTGTGILILSKTTPLTAITGANTTRFVDGNLRFMYPTGATSSLVYPIGDGIVYAPVTITVAGASGGLGITVATATGTPVNENNPITNSSGIEQTLKVANYWTITRSAGANTNYTVLFDHTNTSKTGTPSNYKIRNYNTATSAWINIPTVTAAANTTTGTGMTTFGEFEIGEATTPTPVVTTNPSNVSACALDNVSFTSAVSAGSPTPSIQWQRSNGGAFVDITNANQDGTATYSGFNTPVLTITEVRLVLNAYQYRAVYTSVNGNLTTTAATLTVSGPTATIAYTGSPFCYNGGTITVNQTGQTGGTYTATPAGLSLNATTGAINLGTSTGGNYIITYTFSSGGCSNNTSASITINNNVPVVAAVDTVCSGTSTNIIVQNSVVGVNYQLRNNAGNVNIGSALAGTGSNINLPTGNLASGTTFNILATSSGCSLQLATTPHVDTITSPVVSITPNYCTGGNNVVLTATASNSYLWSTGATTQTITINTPGTYSVTANAFGCSASASLLVGTELVTNGDFSAGNTGFTSGFPYTNASLGLSGGGNEKYAVGNNPLFYHANFWGIDHTTGTGNMLLLNPVSGLNTYSWRQTIAVQPNTTYYLSAWGMSLNNATPFGQLVFQVNGISVGTAVTLPAATGAASSGNTSNNTWVRFTGIWNSGNATSAIVDVKDLQTAGSGNDLAVDDISMSNMNFTANAGNNSPFCQGPTLNLTSTITGDYKAPATYAWTGPNGFTSNLANPAIINAPVAASGVYTVTLTDATGCTTTASTTATITPNTWTGTTSTAWNVAGNWSCGAVPTTINDIVIPSSPVSGNYPSLTTGVGTFRSITIQSGASLTVTGAKMQISGTISNSGTFNATAGTLEFNGSGTAQTITGSVFTGNTVKTLIASNTSGVSVSTTGSDSLNIIDSLAFGASNVALSTGDNIVLVSNALTTARVADITENSLYSGNSITGKVTHQRYIPARRAWRLMTVPLTSTNTIRQSWQNSSVYTPGKGLLVTGPGGGNGLDAAGSTSLRPWSNVSQSLGAVTNTNVPISSGTAGTADNTGYFVFIRGDRNPALINQFAAPNITTLSAKGSVQTGAQTFTLTPNAGAFTLVGNPYASPVDFQKLTRNNAQNKFYVWDPLLNEVGGYVAMDDIDNNGIYEPSEGLSSQDGHIQSGQAFFALTNTAAAASVVFNENDKSTVNNNLLFRPASVIEQFRANLFLRNAVDNTVIGADGATAQFDNSFCICVNTQDNLKLTNVNETFGILRDNVLLSAERRPIVGDADTIFYRLNRSTERSYQLQFIPLAMHAGLKAVLEDSYTNIPVELSMTDTTKVNFVINSNAASKNPDRFRVVFSPAAPLAIACNNWLSTTTYNSYATAGDLDIVGNQLTVEASFNRTMPLGDGVYTGDIVSKHSFSGDANYVLFGNGCEITTTQNGYTALFENCPFILNKVNHVAMVYDGATLKFYRNGFLHKQIACTGNLINNDLPLTFAQIAGPTKLYIAQFLGIINEVRVWNVARTQAQIRTYMDAQLPNPTTQVGLKGYYQFGDLLNKQGDAAYNVVLGPGASISATNPDCSAFVADSCSGTLPVTFADIRAYQRNANNIMVEWTVENELNINHYEIEKSTDGRYFTYLGSTSAAGRSSNVYNWIDVNGVIGDNFYRVKSIGSNGAVNYTRIVKVTIGKVKSAITLYPNPVTSGTTGLQFTNMPKGLYNVRVINAVGQLIVMKQVTHDGGSAAESIILPVSVAAGVYNLEVIKPDNTKTTSSFVISR